MSKFFMDTEFHEYKKKPLFGKPIDTIELISIGIVGEDLNEPVVGGGTLTEKSYYAICKDFDIKAAWNSWQWEQKKVNDGIPGAYKNYWLRENVLKPIFKELVAKDHLYAKQAMQRANVYIKVKDWKFDLKSFSKLLKKYGKSSEIIAGEIKEFVNHTGYEADPAVHNHKLKEKGSPEFYAYYADYDWVVFCWLFGKMIDLPDGFPKYCRDLQQTKYEVQLRMNKDRDHIVASGKIEHYTAHLKDFVRYPKQTNEHNALADARWNKELHNFLTTI